MKMAGREEKNTRYIQKAGALNVRIICEDAMGGMHVIIKKCGRQLLSAAFG